MGWVADSSLNLSTSMWGRETEGHIHTHTQTHDTDWLIRSQILVLLSPPKHNDPSFCLTEERYCRSVWVYRTRERERDRVYKCSGSNGTKIDCNIDVSLKVSEYYGGLWKLYTVFIIIVIIGLPCNFSRYVLRVDGSCISLRTAEQGDCTCGLLFSLSCKVLVEDVKAKCIRLRKSLVCILIKYRTTPINNQTLYWVALSSRREVEIAKIHARS